MIVIPVLTPLLTAAGKEIASWTDCGSWLRVQAVKRKLADDERSDRRRFVETLCRIEPALAEARRRANLDLMRIRVLPAN